MPGFTDDISATNLREQLICSNCHRNKKLIARGLCSTCYQKETRSRECTGCKKVKVITSQELCKSCFDKLNPKFGVCKECSSETVLRSKNLCSSCYGKQEYKKTATKTRLKNYREENREKIRIRSKELRKQDIEKYKKYNLTRSLKKNFGLSLEEYTALVDKQSGCCAICRKHFSELRTRLCVDHDHVTGQICGLLCDNCNKALGLFKESPVLLQSAVAYLQSTKKTSKIEGA